MPLHYFFLREAACHGCHENTLVYRNPVLARDDERAGAVVRDAAVVAFCPDCRRVHELATDQALDCCGTTWPLDFGTYRNGRFVCPHCGDRHTHEQLNTALLPRVLIAVEETSTERRRIRAPHVGEDGEPLATEWWLDRDLTLPAARLGTGETARAKHYGFERIRDLFSPRQAAFFHRLPSATSRLPT